MSSSATCSTRTSPTISRGSRPLSRGDARIDRGSDRALVPPSRMVEVERHRCARPTRVRAVLARPRLHGCTAWLEHHRAVRSPRLRRESLRLRSGTCLSRRPSDASGGRSIGVQPPDAACCIATTLASRWPSVHRSRVTLPRPVYPGTAVHHHRGAPSASAATRAEREDRVATTRRGSAACTIDIIHFIAMSNHLHDSLFYRRGNAPAFYEDFHKLLAKCMNALRGRWENFFASEQPSVVRLETQEAPHQSSSSTSPRIRSRPVSLAQGATTGPVASGLSRTLMTGQPLSSCYTSPTLLQRRRRRCRHEVTLLTYESRRSSATPQRSSRLLLSVLRTYRGRAKSEHVASVEDVRVLGRYARRVILPRVAGQRLAASPRPASHEEHQGAAEALHAERRVRRRLPQSAARAPCRLTDPVPTRERTGCLASCGVPVEPIRKNELKLCRRSRVSNDTRRRGVVVGRAVPVGAARKRTAEGEATWRAVVRSAGSAQGASATR